MECCPITDDLYNRLLGLITHPYSLKSLLDHSGCLKGYVMDIADVILISSDSSDVELHGKKTCNANLMADLT